MNNKRFTDEGGQIINSEFNETSKAYKDVKITDSYIGPKCVIGDGGIIYKSKLHGSSNLNRGCQVSFSEIGFATQIARRATLSGVKIGKFTSISWNTSIGGKKHAIETATNMAASWWAKVFDLEEVPDNSYNFQLNIGNDVWITSAASVLRSADIGDGAIIGSGSVVTKKVEPYMVVAGNPARVIKQRYDDKTIEQLLEVKWWDWPFEVLKKYNELIRQEVTQRTIEKMQEIAASIKK